MRVLVVEDDVKMASLLRRGLVEEGLAADVARTGDDALWMAEATEYDAIVLDVMLPGADGFEVCRRLREAGRWSPVLMLTARDAVEDRVAGLDAGADDYLTKPFSFAELLARLRAIARRAPLERPTVLEAGDLRLDPATRRAWRGASRSVSRRRSSRCSRRSCVALERCSPATSSSSTAGTTGTKPLERRRRLCPLPARENRSALRANVARDGPRRWVPLQRRSVNRLPIRARLTLAFAVAMAVVLAATGALVYLGLRSALDEAINDTLQSRVEDLVAGESPEANSDESWAQVIDGSGRVVAEPGEQSLLDEEELARVEPGRELRLERERVPGIDGRGRLLATAVDGQQGRRVIVAAASLDDRDGALGDLVGQLLIFGPAALLLASLLGYGLATAALRPVEAMREEAATISGAEPGRRLSIGRANDELGRLGTTLNDMLERLDEALEHERSFIADASHELRTPLALLKAELELSLRRPRSAEELEEALRSAATETDRLTSSPSTSSCWRGRTGPPHASAGADRCREPRGRGRRALRGKRAANRGRVPAGLGLSGDRVRLEQALGDLVANALEHGSGTVRITGAADDGRVELHVLDEGDGFTPTFCRAPSSDSPARTKRARAGAPVSGWRSSMRSHVVTEARHMRRIVPRAAPMCGSRCLVIILWRWQPLATSLSRGSRGSTRMPAAGSISPRRSGGRRRRRRRYCVRWAAGRLGRLPAPRGRGRVPSRAPLRGRVRDRASS